MHKNTLILAILALLTAGCLKDQPAPTPLPSASTPLPPAPTPISSTWTYQLQEIDLQKISQTEGRIVVIDPSLNGDGDTSGFWKSEDIQELKNSDKIVLAYLAVGEAEDYRDYWRPEWSKTPPEFITKPVDDQFAGNYRVKYWKEGWQEIILERLDRIAEAGFDGVFLDKVDAFEDWPNEASPAELREEMAGFVEKIKLRGESSKPGFQVFLQNGWAAWDDPRLAEKVDGVAIEELSLGWEGEDGSSTPADVQIEMREALSRAKERGWTLLVVDYPGPDTTPQDKQQAKAEAKRVGALQVLAPRELDGAQ
jgi:cysteinyl-tRNA synthetase, unknown class